jgi:hypothetical protein
MCRERELLLHNFVERAKLDIGRIAPRARFTSVDARRIHDQHPRRVFSLVVKRPHPKQIAHGNGQAGFLKTLTPRRFFDRFVNLHKPSGQTPQTLARIFTAQDERDFSIRAFGDHAGGNRWIAINDQAARRTYGARMIFFDDALDERVPTVFAKSRFHDNSFGVAL